MVVSPDGSFRRNADSAPVAMYENKCKTHNDYTVDVYYTIPHYYIPQVLCEMKGYGCSELLFSCWTKQSTTVLKVTFDDNLWDVIWKVLCSVYGSDNPKRPSKFPDDIKQLRKMISEFQDNNVELLGEFPSCNATNYQVHESEEANGDHEPYIKPVEEALFNGDKVTSDDMMSCAHRAQKWLTEIYRLCRTTASEIFVFTANDLDRQYHSELNNAHPIVYALKGSSMTNECFKRMTQHVIAACEENGLHVLATSSDGQWHRFGVRNWAEEPLTILQLQKDIWNKEKAKPKSTVLTEMRETMVVRSLDDIRFEKTQDGIIVYGHAKHSQIKVFKCHPSRFVLSGKDIVEAKTGDTSSQNDDQESNPPDTLTIISDSCTSETVMESVLSLDRATLIQASGEDNFEMNYSHENNIHFNGTSTDDAETQETVEDHVVPLSTHNLTDEYLKTHAFIAQVTETKSENERAVDTYANLTWGIENAYNALYSENYGDPLHFESQFFSNSAMSETCSSVCQTTTNQCSDYGDSAAKCCDLGRNDTVEKVQVGKDQEKAQSEKYSHSKNQGGKKPN